MRYVLERFACKGSKIAAKLVRFDRAGDQTAKKPAKAGFCK